MFQYLLPDKHEHGKKEVQFRIFKRGDCDDFQDVVQYMAMNGCRPATLRELLAFVIANPRMKIDVLVAVGSVWIDPSKGSQIAFFGNQYGPNLLLSDQNNTGNTKTLFLGVSK